MRVISLINAKYSVCTYYAMFTIRLSGLEFVNEYNNRGRMDGGEVLVQN